ncbi:MAG TPA: DUF2911 domain-containing protein [Thermoanaerobaculia bacterium]|jgi:hypothetical protein
MRKTVLSLAVALIATSAIAQQVKTPRPSPTATFTQTVGVTDITVKYSRPGVKGRTVFGDLVPWDKVWRTGANEATTITFTDDVKINGQDLKKGTYSLHTIPGRDQWSIIFNTVADQWGSYSYDPTKDALKVAARPERNPSPVEWLTIDVPQMSTDEATFYIRWADVSVPFTVNTNSTARTLANFRNAMSPSWQTAYMAANFAFENKAGTPEEMNAWLEQSLKANENIANLWLKARVLKEQGKTAEAIRTAERAIAAATPQQKDFAAEVKRQSDKWR